jgi:hypothetical protein
MYSIYPLYFLVVVVMNLSDEEIQWKILETLYNEWLKAPRQHINFRSIRFEGVNEERLIANANYLTEKGLIDKPQTMGFHIKITAWGIDKIENKRISPDVEIRRNILQTLKDAYQREPERFVRKAELNLPYSDVEVFRNILYLAEKGFVKAYWSLGGLHTVRINAKGIDFLETPTILEREKKAMSYAYSLLYILESRLRTFVEKKLRERYEDEWWTKGVTQKDIRDNAEKRKIGEPHSNLGLINYTEFGDLRRIITNNWDIFESIFKTQQGTISRLDELEPIRNIIAHVRLLSIDQMTKLELFYKEINELIEM